MGRYFRFWLHDENEAALEGNPNWGGTINEALRAHLASEKFVREAQAPIKVVTSLPPKMESELMQATLPREKLCPNGHLTVDGTHCMVKNCKYGK